MKIEIFEATLRAQIFTGVCFRYSEDISMRALKKKVDFLNQPKLYTIITNKTYLFITNKLMLNNATL